MVDSPSGRAPAKAPRWDLADTEGYGGENCVLLAPWMFLGYIGLYRRKKYVGERPRGPWDRGARPIGGACPPISWRLRLFLDLHSTSSGSRSFQKSRSRRFHSVWTPFDIPFLWNTKIGKKHQFALVLGLIGFPKNNIKVYNKAHNHSKQIIKLHECFINYRYVGDVSASPSLIPTRPWVGKW